MLMKKNKYYTNEYTKSTEYFQDGYKKVEVMINLINSTNKIL